jgi:LmeA-like phospholipid-binding
VCDGQPQPAADGPHTPVPLGERPAFEGDGDIVLGQARPAVAHLHHGAPAAVGAQGQDERPARRSDPQGVLGEPVDQLAHPETVGDHLQRASRAFYAEVGAVPGAARRPGDGRLRDQGVQVGAVRVEPEVVGLQPRQGEQIAHEPLQTPDTAAVAEFAARTLLHDRLAAAAGRALGKDSEIEVEGGPALLDVFDRHLDAVDISSDDVTVGRIPDVSVHARLDDIRMTGARSGSVARTHADVEIPAGSLKDAVGGPGGRLQATGVRLDDEADTITLDLQGGLGRATLEPRIADGRLTMHLAAVEIFGGPAPQKLVDRLETRLTDRTAARYPLGLRVTRTDVTDTGLAITLDGGPSRLPTKNTGKEP